MKKARLAVCAAAHFCMDFATIAYLYSVIAPQLYGRRARCGRLFALCLRERADRRVGACVRSLRLCLAAVFRRVGGSEERRRARSLCKSFDRGARRYPRRGAGFYKRFRCGDRGACSRVRRKRRFSRCGGRVRHRGRGTVRAARDFRRHGALGVALGKVALVRRRLLRSASAASSAPSLSFS